MSRGPFSPVPAITIPSVAALESLTLADVAAGTIATVLATGNTYVIGTDGTATRFGALPALRSFTGADATLAPASVTLTGAVVGRAVAGVLVASTGADVSADFETTISVVNKIQQAAGDHAVALITILS